MSGAVAVIGDLLRDVGSLVGLVTGGFVLWERLVRNRPLVFLDSVERAGSRGQPNYILLKVHNPSGVPVLIDVRATPKHAINLIQGDAPGNAVIASIRSEKNRATFQTIRPKSEAVFDLSGPVVHPKSAVPEVTFRITWKPAHVGRWDTGKWLRWPIVLTVSNLALVRMRDPEDFDDLPD